MGNCMERWRQEEGDREQEEMDVGERERAKGSLKDDDYDDDGCVRGEGVGMKVKIVLTRHELEMFLLQLSENYDGKLMMMEDLHKKISSSSSSSSSHPPSPLAWKPSLESIMEYPEVQEMDRDDGYHDDV